MSTVKIVMWWMGRTSSKSAWKDANIAGPLKACSITAAPLYAYMGVLETMTVLCSHPEEKTRKNYILRLRIPNI